jgi:hypothetical protein
VLLSAPRIAPKARVGLARRPRCAQAPSPMHNPSDHLAKRVGKAALDASGRTDVQYSISRDAQHADLRHDPDPAREAERVRLGLLGRIAAVLCTIGDTKVRLEFMWRAEGSVGEIARYVLEKLYQYGKAIGFLNGQ